MKSFEPASSQEALAALIAASGVRRRQALTVIARIWRFPIGRGDCPLTLPDGRQCQLFLQERLLLTYWIDDAVCEVRIVSIEWSS